MVKGEHSTTFTNEDFVKAMEAQGLEIVGCGIRVEACMMTQESEPCFGVHLLEAWEVIKRTVQS